MKNSYRVLTVLVCLLLVQAGAGTQAAPINKSRADFDQIPGSSIIPTNVTPDQQSALALLLAVGQSGSNGNRLSQFLPDVVDSLKSDTSFVWNTNQWTAISRSTHSYDGSNRRATDVTETLLVSTWTNARKSLYHYNGSSRSDTVTMQTWVSSAWKNNILNVYGYDGGGNLTTGIILTWNGSAWVNYYQSLMTYSSGRIATQQLNTWSGSAWVNQTFLTHTYDVNGHETEYLTQTWSGSAWVNQNHYLSTYTGAGDLATRTYQNWTSGAWANSNKHSYVFDGSHHKLLDTTLAWTNPVWFPLYIDSSIYTGNNVTEYVHASLLGAGGDKYFYSYNVNNQRTSEIHQTYDFGSSQYVNSTKVIYVFGTGGSGSCCIGMRGNVNNSGGIELADLSALVSYLTGGGYVPPCLEAANVNGTGAVELADLSALVSYLTGGGYVPPSCP